VNTGDKLKLKGGFKNENKWLYEQTVDENSKTIKIKDSGCSVFMSTPLIIKWNINKLFATSSIFRVIWNFKDIEIMKVICRTSILLLNFH
jgi:hypothetical protein